MVLYIFQLFKMLQKQIVYACRKFTLFNCVNVRMFCENVGFQLIFTLPFTIYLLHKISYDLT